MSVSPALDLRQIAPHQRHSLIFGTFADLLPGQSLELVNDHDPQPLKHQFQLRSPGEFNWTYLDQGPQVWRVQIGKTAKLKGSCCGGCCG